MQDLHLVTVMAGGMCLCTEGLPLTAPLLFNSKLSNLLQPRRERPASSISEAAQM